MSWFSSPKKVRKYNFIRDINIDFDEVTENTDSENDTSFFNLKVSQHSQNIIKVVDMRSLCPPIFNQGDEGSCTCNSTGSSIQFDEIKQNNKNPFVPSRQFMYYIVRELEGTTNSDSGAKISDVIKALNKYGICEESMWPYDDKKISVQLPSDGYAAAKLRAGTFKT